MPYADVVTQHVKEERYPRSLLLCNNAMLMTELQLLNCVFIW